MFHQIVDFRGACIGADGETVTADVLSAALDSGVAVSAILIFFMLQYPDNGNIGKNTIQTWWGNLGWTNSIDGSGTPYLELADGQTFGPTSW